MPRGSRPGERRGGRKRGTPNKSTLWRDALVAELAKNPKVEPLELFLRLMRTPQLPLALRLEMARQALPYLHSKPQARRQTPPHSTTGTDGESRPRVKVRLKKDASLDEEGIELDDDWLGVGRNSVAKSAVDAPNWIEAAARAAGLTAGNDDLPELPAATQIPGTPNGAAAAKLERVGPITFLRALMRHPDTPMHLRLQVALILAPYLHARPLAAPPGEDTFEIEDECGFSVDPALAKSLYELQQALLTPQRWMKGQGSYAEQRAVLMKKLAEQKKRLRCPEGYRWEDVDRDRHRLNELSQRRKDGELAPQEKAEELHLNARVLAHENSAEHAERAQLFDRQAAERKQLFERLTELSGKWHDYSMIEGEQEQFDSLRSRLHDTARDLSDEPFRDPVSFPFYRQVCLEARMRGQPEPTVEEADELLAAKVSSAETVREPNCPAGPDSDDVDFEAWLRGELTYQPWQLRKAARERFETHHNAQINELVVALVGEEDLVPKHELHPYFVWILKQYDAATKDGKPLPKPMPKPLPQLQRPNEL